MVCNRCIMAVKQVLEGSSYHPEMVTLGEVILKEDLNHDQLVSLDKKLVQLGFERIDDRKGRLIESIKNLVIQKIHRNDFIDRKFNWSTVLSEELHYEYNYLSNLFSSLEGITLEQYIIRQKIERAKELLLYDELSLSQIANRLGYSSVAHLSGQFKKVTGMAPSELKRNRQIHLSRKSLDDLT